MSSLDYSNSLVNTNKILEMQKYNGRINLIEMPDPSVQFKMFEKIAVKNKATNYGDALSGNNVENNLLSSVYFSSENIQIIQNGLRAGVYEMSDQKFVISPQNIDQLKIIMRSMYLQYAKHNPDNIKAQVAELNRLVLGYAVPYVYNESMGYMKYLEDQSMLVVPLELPKPINRDFKQLEIKRFM
jgi:hypothetical protein